jgi:hypothetical protein
LFQRTSLFESPERFFASFQPSHMLDYTRVFKERKRKNPGGGMGICNGGSQEQR